MHELVRAIAMIPSPEEGRVRFHLLNYTLICVLTFAPAAARAADGGLPGQNTAEGDSALANLTTGTYNTAIGFHALTANTSGFDNTAAGAQALESNSEGLDNTAVGARALFSNTTGNDNTAVGLQALETNTTGYENTAVGESALLTNSTGINNTAIGYIALTNNVKGRDNTALGLGALNSNIDGNNNTAVGEFALELMQLNGNNNIAVGNGAGANLSTGDNNIYIGNDGRAEESNHIRIGKRGIHNYTAIAGIFGTTIPSGVSVVISAQGQLGTVTSSARFKKQIAPMDQKSEAIFDLKPVTFHYTSELDPDAVPQFGLVAEEVEKVNPDLVARDNEGKAYSVRYEAVNAMLLNEFLKEHRRVEQQAQVIEEQQVNIKDVRAIVAKEETMIAQQQKLIEVLTARVEKIDYKIELSKDPSPIVAEY